LRAPDAAEPDRLARDIEADQVTQVELETMSVPVGKVAGLVVPGTDQSNRDLMQTRLPEVRGVPVDQNDVSLVPAETTTQASRELETAGATTNNDDTRSIAWRRLLHVRVPSLPSWRLGPHTGVNS
jgi:hypothetical protein